MVVNGMGASVNVGGFSLCGAASSGGWEALNSGIFKVNLCGALVEKHNINTLQSHST